VHRGGKNLKFPAAFKSTPKNKYKNKKEWIFLRKIRFDKIDIGVTLKKNYSRYMLFSVNVFLKFSIHHII